MVPVALFFLVFVQMAFLVFLPASAPAGVVPADPRPLDRIFFTFKKRAYVF